jgi:hypothetical protein
MVGKVESASIFHRSTATNGRRPPAGAPAGRDSEFIRV